MISNKDIAVSCITISPSLVGDAARKYLSNTMTSHSLDKSLQLLYAELGLYLGKEKKVSLDQQIPSNRFLFLAQDRIQEEYVGMLTCVPTVVEETDVVFCILRDFIVELDHQKRGVGKHLLKEVFAWAQVSFGNRGWRHFTLQASLPRGSCPAAQAFFLRQGFANCSTPSLHCYAHNLNMWGD